MDCNTVGFFFLKISKEIDKAWRKSRRACEARELILTACGSVSPQSPSLFSASFQTFCLTFCFVLEYAKIRIVLQKEINTSFITK